MAEVISWRVQNTGIILFVLFTMSTMALVEIISGIRTIIEALKTPSSPINNKSKAGIHENSRPINGNLVKEGHDNHAKKAKSKKMPLNELTYSFNFFEKDCERGHKCVSLLTII
jgi:hypothetical protein